MVLLIGLPALAGVSIAAFVYLMHEDPYGTGAAHFLSMVASVLFGLATIISLAALAQNHIDFPAFRAEVEAFRTTAEIARAEGGDAIEGAAFRMSVVELNQEIARTVYWANHPVFGAYWPEEALALEAVR